MLEIINMMGTLGAIFMLISLLSTELTRDEAK